MECTVYLSGASIEWSRVMSIAHELAETGAVQFDDPWWLDARSWSGTDSQVPAKEAHRTALAHFGAIEDASIFWLLAPACGSRGAHVELGYALACRRRFGTSPRISVSGAAADASIFTREPLVTTFHRDEQALQEVTRIARQLTDIWNAEGAHQ